MRSDIEKAIALLKHEGNDGMEQALALMQDSVFSFSMRVCGHREDAEDTMQEVLARSLPYLSKFSSARALAVWLYKVAKNRCLMSRRRSKFAPKENLSLEELMPDRRDLEHLSKSDRIDPENVAIRAEAAHHLRQAIQRLPPAYRIVLVLRDMEGLSDQEVAEITGLRPGTVRVRLHRARLFVRRELAKQRGEISRRTPRQVAASQHQPSRSSSCKAMFAELSDYLDEQLDDSLCEELEKHLGSCEPCQAFLASLEATVTQCREAPQEHPDATKAARLRQKLLEEYRSAMGRRSGHQIIL